MQTVTDEYMMQMRAATKTYTLVILKVQPKRHEPGADKIIWEHGRRNHGLRLQGVLSIVCPVNDGSGIAGIGVFNATVEETTKIMDDDPAVKAGVLTYEVHPTWGFP